MRSTPTASPIPRRCSPAAPAAATSRRSPKAHGSERARTRSVAGKRSRPPADAVMTDLKAFAVEVGAEGLVTVVGGRTQWDVGGTVDSRAREVRAPTGIVEY